jgi:hypothetical protein
MEVCGYTADEALAALATFARESGIAVEETVSMLRRWPTVCGQLVCD